MSRLAWSAIGAYLVACGGSTLPPELGAVSADAGDDAGMDAGEASNSVGPDAASLSTVVALVVDAYHQPLSDVGVLVGGRLFHTDAQGRVSLPIVDATYDIVLVTSVRGTWVYEYDGMTSRTPVFCLVDLYSHGFGQHTAWVTIAVPTPPGSTATWDAHLDGNDVEHVTEELSGISPIL